MSAGFQQKRLNKWCDLYDKVKLPALVVLWSGGVYGPYASRKEALAFASTLPVKNLDEVEIKPLVG